MASPFVALVLKLIAFVLTPLSFVFVVVPALPTHIFVPYSETVLRLVRSKNERPDFSVYIGSVFFTLLNL